MLLPDSDFDTAHTLVQPEGEYFDEWLESCLARICVAPEKRHLGRTDGRVSILSTAVDVPKPIVDELERIAHGHSPVNELLDKTRWALSLESLFKSRNRGCRILLSINGALAFRKAVERAVDAIERLQRGNTDYTSSAHEAHEWHNALDDWHNAVSIAANVKGRFVMTGESFMPPEVGIAVWKAPLPEETPFEVRGRTQPSTATA